MHKEILWLYCVCVCVCNSLATVILQYVLHNSDYFYMSIYRVLKQICKLKNCLGKFILSETSTFVI